MTTNKESSEEKCPKCGSEWDSHHGSYTKFECGSMTQAGNFCGQSNLCLRITAQADEIKRLRKGLRPFASLSKCLEGIGLQDNTLAQPCGTIITDTGHVVIAITHGDLRHAASLLEKKGEGQ